LNSAADSPAPVRYRRATAADVPALAALYAEAAITLGPQVYTPEQVAAWAGFGADTPAFRRYVLGASTWVAERASDGLSSGAAPDGPAGFCGIDADGEVHSLYVRAGLTRQGLGSGLLAHAMAQARAGGVQHFNAWATPFSRPVFERAGLRWRQTVVQPYMGVLFERYRVGTA
jgi:putative acetyltransferase